MGVPDWRLWLADEDKCKNWMAKYKARKVLRQETRVAETFMEKAVHNLSFANWLMEKHEDEIPKIFGPEENFYDWTIVAFYYSIYHAALALLAKFKLSSKSHFATLCAVIHFYYHKSKCLTETDIDFLGQHLGMDDVEAFVRTKFLRERASYGVSRQFELMLAQEAKENSEKFLDKVMEIVK